MITADRCISC